MLVKAPCGPGRAFSNQVPRYPTIPPSSRGISYRDLFFSLPSGVSRSLSRDPPPGTAPACPIPGQQQSILRAPTQLLLHPAASRRSFPGNVSAHPQRGGTDPGTGGWWWGGVPGSDPGEGWLRAQRDEGML